MPEKGEILAATGVLWSSRVTEVTEFSATIMVFSAGKPMVCDCETNMTTKGNKTPQTAGDIHEITRCRGAIPSVRSILQNMLICGLSCAGGVKHRRRMPFLLSRIVCVRQDGLLNHASLVHAVMPHCLRPR